MEDTYDLQRFVDAQDPVFARVLEELSTGRKHSHWMWFVFPQIIGLGRSEMARRFAITCLDEARAYLAHPVLGPRLEQCAKLIEPHTQWTARQIFGSPDDVKLQSSMTLFAAAAPERKVFQGVLDTFFDGRQDSLTLEKLSQKNI
ncbi:calpastatin [Pseudomonas sp. S25]|uniref:Calpastatin n=1 Tax=Pseudomonas maioricensis TaxID=1766623 RepID=A0ABS9ZKV1_9PSED|nr:DUF1810 domain-containing protein [Pseudomonas sp. S25]MCI8211205.1 calpastatin [Pseudomonas sp. S25]